MLFSSNKEHVILPRESAGIGILIKLVNAKP